jgi:hypothetical protein
MPVRAHHKPHENVFDFIVIINFNLSLFHFPFPSSMQGMGEKKSCHRTTQTNEGKH